MSVNRTRRGRALVAAPALFCALLTTACPPSSPPAPPATPTPPVAPPVAAIEANDWRLSIFKPVLPAEYASTANPITEEKITLGRILYFDNRLSKNQDVSCNTCHDLASYGVDGKKVSSGHKKQLGSRNSPTVYNAAGHFVQFWDGRARDVEEQASGPMMNPVEMAMAAPAQVEAVLRSMPKYVELFKKAFPADKDPVSIKNATLAIGAFERRLVTPGRWDKFLGGDKTALTEDEKKGLGLFLQVGCITCHTGTHLGGAMYQKAGLVKPWPNQTDLGRFAVTKLDVDKMMFKVPTLRNIEKTAPYFHDGSVDKLEVAVKMMASHQLGRELSDADATSIATFLRALTGPLPEGYIKAPELPLATAKTPKADPA